MGAGVDDCAAGGAVGEGGMGGSVDEVGAGLDVGGLLVGQPVTVVAVVVAGGVGASDVVDTDGEVDGW